MLSNDPVNKQLVSGISTISTHLDIKNSPIQGKGLFTTHVLRNGTILFQIVGETFRHEYNPALSDQNPNWIGIGHEQWLQLRPSDIAIYLNHSCNPNVIINEKLELITISLLRPNEELLLDYSTTELDPYWEMDCNCGAAQCRKLLRSFQFLPEDLQAKYRKYLAASFSSTASVLAVHQRAS